MTLLVCQPQPASELSHTGQACRRLTQARLSVTIDSLHGAMPVTVGLRDRLAGLVTQLEEASHRATVAP